MNKIFVFIKSLLKKESVRYLICGGVTTVLSMVIYNTCLLIFDNLDLNYQILISNTISTVVAVIFAFIVNKMWVFEQKSLVKDTVVKEFLKFSLGRFFTFLIESLLLIILAIIFHPVICKLITQILTIVLNYIISKKAVFNNKHNSKNN